MRKIEDIKRINYFNGDDINKINKLIENGYEVFSITQPIVNMDGVMASTDFVNLIKYKEEDKPEKDCHIIDDDFIGKIDEHRLEEFNNLLAKRLNNSEHIKFVCGALNKQELSDEQLNEFNNLKKRKKVDDLLKEFFHKEGFVKFNDFKERLYEIIF